MTRIEWIKKQCEPTQAVGQGTWIELETDSELGTGIFQWNGEPNLSIYEYGIKYSADKVLRLRFDEIIDANFFDLRSLMKAQRSPGELVEFTLTANSGRHVLRIPLYWYTTLDGILFRFVKNGIK